MTTLGRKKTLLTAVLSGALAFSPVLSTAPYAFADTPLHAMGTVSSEARFIQDMEAGGSVTLVQDITVKQNVNTSKSVTLDLGGHVLTLESNNGIIVDGGVLSISNGTIVNEQGNIITANAGSVSISDGVFKSSTAPLVKNGTGSFQVTGGEFSKVYDAAAFKTDFVKEGYTAVGEGGSIEVLKGDASKRFPEVLLSKEVYVYSGEVNRPEVTVKDEYGNVLKENTDYTLKYSNNIDAGTATVRIEGQGKYSEYVNEKHFAIEQTPMTISAPTNKYYAGSIAEGDEFAVTATGLLKGHSFKTEPVAIAEIAGVGTWESTYALVVDTSDIVIVDADGYDVTDNYKFTVTDGLVTSYDYSSIYDLIDIDTLDYTTLNLSNATVTFTQDPAPYKGTAYSNRENIKSVVVNGIDVTSRCNFSYSSNTEAGSTVTVTVTPSYTLYSNTGSSNNNNNGTVRQQSISAASEEEAALRAQSEDEEQITAQANELSSWLSSLYRKGTYQQGTTDYELLYYLMNNGSVNSSYYYDLMRYLYRYYGVSDINKYLTTYSDDALLDLIYYYYRAGNGSYYGNNGVTFTYNNRTYRLTGSKTASFKISGDATNSNTVTVSANNVTKRQGDSDPTFTATVLGPSNLDKSKITYSISRVQGETPGTYAINVTGAAEQNGYKVTYVPGTLTITAASDTNATNVAGTGTTTPATGTATTTAAPTSPATVAASTSANKLAATGDNTFLGYGILALVGVAVAALGVFFSHRKKDEK